MAARPHQAGVLAVLTAAALLGPAAADEVLLPPPLPPPLPSHSAEYLLTRDGLPFGVMTLELIVTPAGAYRYEAHTKPHAAAVLMQALELGEDPSQTEVSIGQVDAGRFRPREYHFRRDGGEASRTLDLNFDWGQGRAHMASEGKPWSMEVPDQAQDKLSVLLALRQDLETAAVTAPGPAQAERSYRVADGGRLKTYSFRVLGHESLPGPQGERDTLALERSKDGQAVDYRLWTDPALHQLPVRVEREEAGGLYVMELVRVSGDGADP